MPRLVPGVNGGTNVVWDPGEQEAYFQKLRGEIETTSRESGTVPNMTAFDEQLRRISQPQVQPRPVAQLRFLNSSAQPQTIDSATGHTPGQVPQFATIPAQGQTLDSATGHNTNSGNGMAQIDAQPMLNVIDSMGRPSQIGWNQIDAALNAGSRLVDSSGQPFEMKQVDGGWVVATNQGWLPMQMLAGGQWAQGQQERITQAVQQGQLPQLQGPNQGLGFGSLTQTFNEPFTGQGGSGYQSKPFTDEFKFDYDSALQSPAFQRRLDEGRKLIERSKLGTSGLYSGRTGKEMMRFGQDLASDELEKEFGRAWNTYQDKKGTFYANEGAREADYNKSLNEYRMRHDIFKGNQNDIFNRYSSLAGLGQTAASNLGSTSQSFGNSIGNTILAGGQARAGGVARSASLVSRS